MIGRADIKGSHTHHTHHTRHTYHESSKSVEMCSEAQPLAATHDAKRSSQSLGELPRTHTVKNLPLDRVPSPRVKRVHVRAASGLGK